MKVLCQTNSSSHRNSGNNTNNNNSKVRVQIALILFGFFLGQLPWNQLLGQSSSSSSSHVSYVSSPPGSSPSSFIWNGGHVEIEQQQEVKEGSLRHDSTVNNKNLAKNKANVLNEVLQEPFENEILLNTLTSTGAAVDIDIDIDIHDVEFKKAENVGDGVENRHQTTFLTNKELKEEMNSVSITSQSLQRLSRQLSSTSSQIESFEPLYCNANLSTAPCTNIISSINYLSEAVRIPCGECWIWDVTSNELDEGEGQAGEVVLEGLDIEGKLLFPENIHVAITTPYIIVQGELVLTNTHPIISPSHTGVTFNLSTKQNGMNVLWKPRENPNRNVCVAFENKKCDFGQKAFVVAGGKVNIEAFPSSNDSSTDDGLCETWTTIKNVNYIKPTKNPLDFPSFESLPDTCPSSGLTFIHENFDTPYPTNEDEGLLPWNCQRGSYADVINGSLTCTNRKQTFQGPLLDLTRYQPHSCLIPHQDYIFTIKFQLFPEGEEMDVEASTPPCKLNGEGCPTLYSWFGNDDSTKDRVIATMGQYHVGNYGDTMMFTGIFNLNEEQLSTDNDWNLVYLGNVEVGTDIAIESFDIQLPNEGSYVDPTNPCNELVLNGNANVNGVSPYPFYTTDTNGGNMLQVLEESNQEGGSTNHFFRLSERENYKSSIQQELYTACMDVGVRYYTSIDIRIHSSIPTSSSIQLQIQQEHGASTSEEILKCPAQSLDDGWVTCSGTFIMNDKMNSASQITFYHQLDEDSDEATATVDYDNVIIRYDRGYAGELVVNKDVTNCWGTGSEIHVTSSTFFNDGSVKGGNGYTGTIANVREEGDYAVIELADAPFDPIISEVDSVNFAAEVALLSRNVKIQGQVDDADNQSIGGYLMILHTEAHEQIIQGVEFRHMGQLSAEDRFPIHSLFNGNLEGSDISKNSIVGSHHRGIVIEGTSNLTLSQNVGVLTKGHFFYCRDDCDGNDFVKNLVSQTQEIRGQDKLPGEEDTNANAFHILQASNNFYGNVASASDNTGFKIYIRNQSRGENGNVIDGGDNPQKVPLGAFIGNAAHSNNRRGMSYSYYENHQDDAPRYEIENFRSFKNLGDGLNIYRAWRGTVKDSIFAENKRSIDIHWSDDMEILNTKILGMTDLTRGIIQYPQYKKLCDSSSSTDAMVGLRSPTHIYRWKTDNQHGARLENVEFSGFDDSFCSSSTHMEFQGYSRDGHWDYFTSLNNVTFEDGPDDDPLIDGCSASGLDDSVRDIVITSIDDNASPVSFVSDSNQMKTFAKESCTQYPSMCMAYCEDTCLRTVRFNVDQYHTQNWTMKVINDEGKHVSISGRYEFDDDAAKFTSLSNTRLFSASLPSGSYAVSFFNENGEESWPRFSEQVWEEIPDCIGHAGPLNISVFEPSPLPGVCDNNVVLNGDIEDGMDYWLQRGGALILYADGGIGASQALVNTGRSKTYHGPLTNVDTRCFNNQGNYFEVEAWVRHENGKNGKKISCDHNSNKKSKKCGKVQLRRYHYVDDTKVETTYSSMDIARSVAQYEKADGFTMIHGVFKIDDDIASAEKVSLLVTDIDNNYDVIIDNMKMTPLRTQTGCYGNIIRNGRFDDGTSMYWEDYSSSTSIVQSSGSFAIKNTDRSSTSDDIRQYIHFDCLSDMIGHRYAVKAKFKLEKKDGTPIVCDMLATSGDFQCPEIHINNNNGKIATIGRAVSSIDNDWSLISGVYTVNPEDLQTEDIFIRLRNVARNINVIYDEISLTHIPLDCQNLALNPSFDDGSSSFWLKDDIDESSAIIISPGADSLNYALLFQHSNDVGDFLYQKLDSRCFVQDMTYDIRVKFKLFDKANATKAVGCDPSITSTETENRCPMVRIHGTGCNDSGTLSYKFLNELPFFEWNNEDFNEFYAELPVDANLASCDDVKIQLGYFLESSKLLAIDDVRITPVTTSSPTEYPTLSPTYYRGPTSSPTSITLAPSVSLTSTCPLMIGTSVKVSSGQNLILSAQEDLLCTLTKVVLDENNSVITMIPVARSYDKNLWELSGGSFAASFSYGEAFVCYENGCQFMLPSVESNEAYHLTSSTHDISEQEEVVRFLETSTFGSRKDEIDSFNNDYIGEYKFSQWMMDQMDIGTVGLTSHREYFRTRSNARLYNPTSSGVPDHPCDSFSRWRKFSIANIDYPENKDERRPIRIRENGSGSFVISMNGHMLTVADIRVPGSYENYVFDETHDYLICNSKSDYRVDGKLYLSLPNKKCVKFNNPAVDFTLNEHLIPSENLISLDDWSLLDPIDGNFTTAEEFFLPNGYNGTECNNIPLTTTDSPFIFGRLPDSSYVVYDPHLILNLNTAESPRDNGGIDIELKSEGDSYCMNAPRTFVNEENCVISQYACGSTSAGNEIEFVLNEASIVELQEKSGRFVYGMLGFQLEELQHPCTDGLRSRWEIKDSSYDCNPTELYSETQDALVELLTSSDDDNPFIRDVYFSDAILSCNSLDNEIGIEIEIDSVCYKRVHDEYLSVFDVTYWTAEDTHPGNSFAAANGRRNPIKKWAEDGLWYLTFPSDHPLGSGFDHTISRWNTNYQYFNYVGRFGDKIRLNDLPIELRADEVIDHFGTEADISGAGVLVCGSFGEVANDKSLGSIFDYRTGVDRYENFNHGSSRHLTWIAVALLSNDQLRQRVAWAISQILIIVNGSVRQSRDQPEWFLYYYDIFVRHAFGNYRDILKEISYSPLMAENLSYLRSKSFAYMWERDTVKVDADENFAREIMQLFTIGTIELNIDGTPKLDSNGKTILTYTNDDIMSFAKAWTGFETHDRRGNLEHTSSNQLDPMRIEAPWRDRFPKTNLYGGYIGDFFPLCVDLPERMFLRKGAHYKFLGSSNLPESMLDPSEFATDGTIKLFTLEESSILKEVLCNDKDGDGYCDFKPFITLESNLVCTGIECDVDTVRVIEVQTGIFYEYYPIPCVEQLIYDDAMKVSTRVGHDAMCANPKLPVASEACCELGSNTANRFAVYDGERMKFNSAEDRCFDSTTGTPLDLCNFHQVVSDEYYKAQNYFWTSAPCKLQVKVDTDGQVAVVHEPSLSLSKVLHVNDNTENFFKVFWHSENYPSFDEACSGACEVLAEGSCLCDTSVKESQVFYSMPTSKKNVLSKLFIGALNPQIHDEGIYTSSMDLKTNLTAHMKKNKFDKETIFELVDPNGVTMFLKNSVEVVNINHDGHATGFEFRNAPVFMSLIPNEETSRDASYETDAVIDHYFYHDNTAPFISIRLIQRLVTSNPSPRYVKTVATAFKMGLFEDGPYSFGSGKYGDLKATIAAILLDREARSVVLDADPTHGSLREPLLKVIGFMRSMEFIVNRDYSPIVLSEMNAKIGQMAYQAPSVFSFFLPEFQPAGKISEGTLASPESTVLDMPTIIGFVNGMFSMIRYGLGKCQGGFGKWSIPCREGEYENSDGWLSFNSSATYGEEGYATEVVDELATILTAGRLRSNERQYISNVVNDTSSSIDEAVRTAQELIITSPEFHSTNIVKGTDVSRSKSSLPEPSGKPYKAVIFFMLAGGMDSYNMLMPHACSNNLAEEYLEIRGDVALAKSNVDTITATGQVCETFGVHKKLSKVTELYQEGDLAFLANVGVLTTPVTKKNYNALTETQLFAHNTMQRETKQIDPNEEKANSGVLGRMTDSLSKRGYNVASFSLSGFSHALVGQKGITEGQVIVNQNGVPSPRASDTFLTHVENLSNQTVVDSGFFADTWSENLIGSIGASEIFGDILNGEDAPVTNTTFPDTKLGDKLALVSKLMATHEERGVDVDTFYVEMGGFDTHNNVENALDDKFEEINGAISAFTTELKWLQLWNQTVVIQASDFARTLVPNSGDGTDHAWGGNYLLFGGPVKGGEMYGRYVEEMHKDAPQFLKRGRIIPTTPWDSVFNAMAMWLDDGIDLDNVCPNRHEFPSLYTDQDLFLVE